MLIQKSSLSTRTTLTCDKNGGCTRIHHVSYFRRMISNDQRDIDHRIIRSVYETFMPINDELHELIVSKTTYVEIAKGQEFIQQGGPNDQLGLLVDGLMRSVEIIDGDDHTMIFFDAPCFVTEYVGFLRREPSRHSIIALEDCRLYVWSYDDLQKMYSLSKESERVGFDTATERYEKLTATFPKLVQRVPQYMIASYLGVTPESLSRIRAKLIKE
jgi:CRP-like cAMP-binding protein